MYQDLHWRMIGPFRGGRTVSISGIPGQPNVFYMAPNNGGVWKTTDAGRTWNPIFDDQPTGSIGALAIAPSNPDIIYVGSGEGLRRPDLSVGDGIYKSTDAGRTWQHLGLRDAQQISSIIVDPKDPNRLFVAAQGHPYGPNPERGVYRSLDGGQTFQKVLYKDEDTGGMDLVFDPHNSQTIFASMWTSRRPPWTVGGGYTGKGSGLYKSTDGGNTWHQLTQGLPGPDEGIGRIGPAVSPSDPDRMYAWVNAKKGSGIYRSDDAGQTWQQMNNEERVWGRGDDFGCVRVDPRNKDVIYVANTSTYKSTDAGKNFTAIKGAPGGDDYHTIWINPDNPDIIAIAVDQGATISVNGGQTWSSWYNQPTAQFYHVITDNQFPYWVYGGQQESGSIGTASRSDFGEITFRDWTTVGVEEYGYVAPDPLHPNLIYGGKATVFDRNTGQTRDISPVVLRTGQYRFNRTAPLLFSPVGSAHPLSRIERPLLHPRRRQQLANHQPRPDPRRSRRARHARPVCRRRSRQRQASRRDLFHRPLAERRQPDLGRHRRRPDSSHSRWRQALAKRNSARPDAVEQSRPDGRLAFRPRNRLRRHQPLPPGRPPSLYLPHPRRGKSWQKIVTGLPDDPVNTVREDPERKGLLFAGTERSVYVSFDDGDHWQSLKQNLPPTSIRDLVVHNDDIVVGTHGRSFWILDNITPLRQAAAQVSTAAYLFAPQMTYRVRRNNNTDTPLPPEEPAGQNPPDGAMIDYWLKSASAGPSRFGDPRRRRHSSPPLFQRRQTAARQPEGTQCPDVLGASSPRAVGRRRHAPLSLGPPFPSAGCPPTRVSNLRHRSRHATLSLGRRGLAGTIHYFSNRRRQELYPTSTPPNGPARQDIASRPAPPVRPRPKNRRRPPPRLPGRPTSARPARPIEVANRTQAQPRGRPRKSPTLETKASALEGEEGASYLTTPEGRSLVRLNSGLGTLLSALDSADAAPTTQQSAMFVDLDKAVAEQLSAWEQMKSKEVADLDVTLKQSGLPALNLTQQLAAPLATAPTTSQDRDRDLE